MFSTDGMTESEANINRIRTRPRSPWDRTKFGVRGSQSHPQAHGEQSSHDHRRMPYNRKIQRTREWQLRQRGKRCEACLCHSHWTADCWTRHKLKCRSCGARGHLCKDSPLCCYNCEKIRDLRERCSRRTSESGSTYQESMEECIPSRRPRELSREDRSLHQHRGHSRSNNSPPRRSMSAPRPTSQQMTTCISTDDGIWSCIRSRNCRCPECWTRERLEEERETGELRCEARRQEGHVRLTCIASAYLICEDCDYPGPGHRNGKSPMCTLNGRSEYPRPDNREGPN